MKKYYIAGIMREEDGTGYSVYFPDVPNVCAGGSDLAEAIANAEDGLYEALRGLAEDNKPIPEPSGLQEAEKGLRAFHEKIGMAYPADTLYQHIAAPDLDMTPVRINVSFPKSVLAEIDRNAKLAGMTRSGFLAKAALAYNA